MNAKREYLDIDVLVVHNVDSTVSLFEPEAILLEGM
jgi:hypothetical protein